VAVVAGQRVLQLLPLNEMAPGQQSPYTAISAMAIDPIFISVPAVPDFQALGGEVAMSAADRSELAACARRRTSSTSRYDAEARRADGRVRPFHGCGVARDTDARAMFKSFVSEQAWWVEPYALFRAIHAQRDERPWTEWPVELQRLEPVAIDSARRELARQVRFYQYLQWLAATQWQEARRAARDATVGLFGDLPFMVDGDSADVWARQRQFRFDCSTGAPPDAFSATGQDWGVPLYRLGRGRGRRLPLAARARAPQRGLCTTATASIISSASIAPTATRATAARLLHAGRRTGADGARRTRPRRVPRRRRGDHRRGSGHGARCRARVARAARHPRFPRSALGT
jgi:4-alpha-glucanotransferase